MHGSFSFYFELINNWMKEMDGALEEKTHGERERERIRIQ